MDEKMREEILDMAVRTHHEMLSEHGHKLCNCFREKFVQLLQDYMEHKEEEMCNRFVDNN